MVVLRLLGLLLDLLLLPLRLLQRGRAVRPGTWLGVTIDGPVVDLVAPERSWKRLLQVRAQKAVSLHRLDEAVRAMSADDRVKGLLVTIRSLGAGMGAAASLRAILARARAAGKEVAVHLPMGGGSKEVYVASAASKVFLGPTTHLMPLGFRSGSVYVKSALDKAGIEPQVFACGEFKSAGESLVRDSMSPQQRAQLERIVESFHDALAEAIAEGRGVSRERAVAMIDEAPYFGRAAVDAGLADDLAYDDEVPVKLGLARVTDLVDAGGYLARVKRPLVRRLGRASAIAVIPIHGPITHVAGAFGALSTDERVGRMVRAARKDQRVRGVILHVDSPGGSALASDRMHHEIVQLAREKPVVCCMANVAASGGYYVAAPAKRIVAQPTTITGSIGVVAARLSLDGLFAKLGVTEEKVSRGARASLLSAVGPLDDDDRAALTKELDATYRAFVGVVAVGRSLPEPEVEQRARGRVYTGTDAHAAKLVDVLGGFDVAVAELRELLDASVRDEAEVVLATTPQRAVPVLDPPKAAAAALAALLPPRERVLLELAGERVLALGPIVET
ncbi:MAG: signal peptide peptidase SppA [Labilithrix sp.]|nr:signal peptide peptidase SppA [Labilithrix sp.]MCW5811229.1 signal peptide peptidase SppA [Labilithrix sp.]